MKKLLVLGILAASQAQADLVITGVIDGTLKGGTPKAVEVYATKDIADLSVYGLGSANNGKGSDGQEFTFPNGALKKGSYLYVASEQKNFEAFMGFKPNHTSSMANINGDDAIELFKDGNVIDVFGDVNKDGTNTAWEYKDGWANRNSDSRAPNNGTFNAANWTFSGKGKLSGVTAVAQSGYSVKGSGNGNGGGNGNDGALVCGADNDQLKRIHQIQGDITDLSNDASPLLGQTVTVEAVVTTDLQGGKLANGDSSYQYSGFWIQEEREHQDANNNTSEGIFVYDYKNKVNVGDKVRLQASVAEFKNITQLKNVKQLVVCANNQTLPPVVEVTLPVKSLTQWEALEGMRIEATQEVVVSDLFGTGYGFGNYGQFVVSSKLHFQPTEVALPKSEQAAKVKQDRLLDTLLVDDGVAKPYPSFIPFPNDNGFSTDNPIRIGDTVVNLTGVLHGYKNNYWVIPSQLDIVNTNERLPRPHVAHDANLIIVGMNVLNYFNGDGQGGGFPTSRGARTYEAFEMQRDKIVAALDAMNADVIGLMELENDGFGENSAINDLLVALNKVQSKGSEYSYITAPRSLGTDVISVGLMYRKNNVQPIGNTIVLDSSNSPVDSEGNALFVDSKNRPSLIQSFVRKDKEGEFEFTVSVNHLKSKGRACGEPNERQDGQGACNIMRTRAAKGLTQFLANNPTGVETDNIMILGDLNAYSKEDPMQVFKQAGYTNLKYTDKATERQPYSYTFSGALGSLDHALAKGKWVEDVVSVDAWHINSVEAPLMDYQTEATGQKYKSVDNYAAPDAYRSSDHDPIVVGMNVSGGSVTLGALGLLALIGLRRKRQ